MKALLDTHTFLWWNINSPELSDTARDFIADGSNEIYLSAASAWEIAIKYAKGRLELPETPEQYVAHRLTKHGFSPLPIQLSHALHVYQLPPHHQDPFDRLLIAQSQLEALPLLSIDSQIKRYNVSLVW